MLPRTRDVVIVALVVALAVVEALTAHGGASLAGRAGALLASYAIGTAAGRSPRRLHVPALAALALVLVAAPPETPGMAAGLVCGGFSLGFLVQRQLTRSSRLRAEIEALSTTLTEDLAALARDERERIQGHLAGVVGPVSAVASRVDDAPADRDAALAVLEDARRSAKEALGRLRQVLGELSAAAAAAADERAGRDDPPRSRLQRIVAVHAFLGPWLAFSAFGTIEQLTLPDRPATVDGHLYAAPAYPQVVVLLLCWLTPLPLLLRFRAPVVAGALIGPLLVARVAADDLSSLTWAQNLLGVTIAVIAGTFARSTRESLAGLAVAAVTMVLCWSLEQRAIADAEWLYLVVLLAIAHTIGRRVQTELRTGRARRADLAELTARRRWLVRQVRTVERARAAQELHDLVGHGLSLVSLRATVAKGRVEGGETSIDEAMREVQGLIAATERELVGLHQRLGALGAGEVEPGLEAVRTLVETAREHGHPVELRLDAGVVAPATAEVAVDVVREALTNVRKHAGPAPTRVTVTGDDDLEVVVVNAAGAPTLGAGSQSGLERLRERAAAQGARLTWGTTPGGGWEVRLRAAGRPRAGSLTAGSASSW